LNTPPTRTGVAKILALLLLTVRVSVNATASGLPAKTERKVELCIREVVDGMPQRHHRDRAVLFQNTHAGRRSAAELPGAPMAAASRASLSSHASDAARS
jgi:hypothetical protein